MRWGAPINAPLVHTLCFPWSIILTKELDQGYWRDVGATDKQNA